MSLITTQRRAYKDSNSNTECLCLMIVLQDGQTFRYNDSHLNLTMTQANENGVLQVIDPVVMYYTLPEMTYSSIGASADTATAMDFESVMTSIGFSRELIAQGRLNNSRMTAFMTDYNNPVENDEPLFAGFWGETTMIDGRYIAKFNSLISTLDVDTSRIFSRTCDTRLGSTKCGVKMDGITWTNGSEYNPNEEDMKEIPEPVRSFRADQQGSIQTEFRRIPSPFGGFANLYDTYRVLRWRSQQNQDTGYGVLTSEDSRKPWYDYSNNIRSLHIFDQQRIHYYEQSGGFQPAIKVTEKSCDVILIIDRRSAIIAPLKSNDEQFGFPLIDNTLSSTLYTGTIPAGSGLTFKVYDSAMNELTTRQAIFNYTSLGNVALLISLTWTSPTPPDVMSWLGAFGGDFYISYLAYYRTMTLKRRLAALSQFTVTYKLPTPLTTNPELINTTNNNILYDAKLRTPVKVPAYPYVLFEQTTTGARGLTTPSWNPTLGAITIDGAVQWKAVPARVITLTTIANTGTNSVVTTNEALPVSFNNKYQNGSIEFLTGPNTGLSFPIVYNQTDQFAINAPLLTPTTAGDQVRITQACFKTIEDCKLFGNNHNFRGFSTIPSKNIILRRGDK